MATTAKKASAPVEEYKPLREVCGTCGGNTFGFTKQGRKFICGKCIAKLTPAQKAKLTVIGEAAAKKAAGIEFTPRKAVKKSPAKKATTKKVVKKTTAKRKAA